ncbi:MAG: transposase [Deltaproteobacteria bacterium]|nr:transposase [Deltaproteobacteria bacterium]
MTWALCCLTCEITRRKKRAEMSARSARRACLGVESMYAQIKMRKGGEGQMSIDFRTWGGARVGAGRKKVRRKSDPSHRTRDAHPGWHPVHVVLRTLPAVGRLRRRRIYQAIRRAVAKTWGRVEYRIVHLSIQHNHLHLLVEASSKETLALGMQSFATCAAKAINKALERAGKVFAHRYHATAVTSPRQTRNALAYILCNWRHHGEARGTRVHLDRFSSAISFDRWSTGGYRLPDQHDPLPVRPAETWLLRIGWSPSKSPAVSTNRPHTTVRSLQGSSCAAPSPCAAVR